MSCRGTHLAHPPPPPNPCCPAAPAGIAHAALTLRPDTPSHIFDEHHCCFPQANSLACVDPSVAPPGCAAIGPCACGTLRAAAGVRAGHRACSACTGRTNAGRGTRKAQGWLAAVDGFSMATGGRPAQRAGSQVRRKTRSGQSMAAA